jgi:hypothetical protein
MRISLSWSSPGAVSYRLSVSRDGGSPQTLIGATTATTTSFRLEPGHSYSFTVAASDPFGRTVTSSPYAVTLGYSAVKLDLRASASAGKRMRLSAVFAPAGKSITRAGRRLRLESFNGRTWRRFATASTSKTGVATWALTLPRGSYRLRVSFAGADDLTPATSRIVTLRVR